MKRMLLLLLCGVFVAAAVACGTAEPVQSAARLLELGEQYLLDLEYEQALAQFLQVIEIEPMNARAYIGAAEAYVGLGDVESAVAILEQGLAATGDPAIAQLLEQLQPSGDEESGEQLPPADPVAEKLHEYLSAGQEAAAFEYCLSADFQSAWVALEGEAFGYGGEVDADGAPSGMGTAYYAGGYVYYGPWDAGAREGEALYFRVVEGYMVEHRGTWAGDRPNGRQRRVSQRDVDDIDPDPDTTYALRTEMEADYVNGLANGSVSDVWQMNDGDTHRWSYSVEMGVPVALSQNGDGSVDIAICAECGAKLVSDPGDLEGIPPFDQ